MSPCIAWLADVAKLQITTEASQERACLCAEAITIGRLNHQTGGLGAKTDGQATLAVAEGALCATAELAGPIKFSVLNNEPGWST